MSRVCGSMNHIRLRAYEPKVALGIDVSAGYQDKEEDGVIGRQCREVLSYASICCGITRADTDRRGKLGTDSVKSVVVWTEVENRP